MIYGIGTDISQIDRFGKWIKDPNMFLRFFNENEQFDGDMEKHFDAACRHYAARFAAKEAFAKALGTGFTGLKLSDFWVAKTPEGQPYIEMGDTTKAFVEKRAGTNLNIKLSISHEKDYAVAFVIIEKLS